MGVVLKCVSQNSRLLIFVDVQSSRGPAAPPLAHSWMPFDPAKLVISFGRVAQSVTLSSLTTGNLISEREESWGSRRPIVPHCSAWEVEVTPFQTLAHSAAFMCQLFPLPPSPPSLLLPLFLTPNSQLVSVGKPTSAVSTFSRPLYLANVPIASSTAFSASGAPSTWTLTVKSWSASGECLANVPGCGIERRPSWNKAEGG